MRNRAKDRNYGFKSLVILLAVMTIVCCLKDRPLVPDTPEAIEDGDMPTSLIDGSFQDTIEVGGVARLIVDFRALGIPASSIPAVFCEDDRNAVRIKRESFSSYKVTALTPGAHTLIFKVGNYYREFSFVAVHRVGLEFIVDPVYYMDSPISYKVFARVDQGQPTDTTEIPVSILADFEVDGKEPFHIEKEVSLRRGYSFEIFDFTEVFKGMSRHDVITVGKSLQIEFATIDKGILFTARSSRMENENIAFHFRCADDGSTPLKRRIRTRNVTLSGVDELLVNEWREVVCGYEGTESVLRFEISSKDEDSNIVGGRVYFKDKGLHRVTVECVVDEYLSYYNEFDVPVFEQCTLRLMRGSSSLAGEIVSLTKSFGWACYYGENALNVNMDMTISASKESKRVINNSYHMTGGLSYKLVDFSDYEVWMGKHYILGNTFDILLNIDSKTEYTILNVDASSILAMMSKVKYHAPVVNGKACPEFKTIIKTEKI